MIAGASIVRVRWAGPAVILLLVLCVFYATERAIRLAITNDEIATLASARQNRYAQLFWGEDWNSKAHFLNAVLAKLCVRILPQNEIVASRLPSLLGLGLFLWGVWRIGVRFPTGTTRVLVTLALLSNVFLLDFFGISRGYGLALGFTVLSLSFLIDASHQDASKPHESVRRAAVIALWLAFGAALSNVGFVYLYAALLPVVLYFAWGNWSSIQWWISPLMLGAFYVNRITVARSRNELYFGGETGFVHDTIGSLVRCSFYDTPVPPVLVSGISGGLALLVLLLAWWSYRERIRSTPPLCVMVFLVATFCGVAHRFWHVKFPMERAVLYLVPLFVLIVAIPAAWSCHRCVRLGLCGLLLVYTGMGVAGVNLSHTLTWRNNADIPSMLLALREAHQRTGEEIQIALSDSTKWSVWYYAEHLLELPVQPSETNTVYARTYEWVTLYEWKGCEAFLDSPSGRALLPGTTHLFLDRDDDRILTHSLAGNLGQTNLFPASDMVLYTLTTPNYRGTIKFPDGFKYVGEFRNGQAKGLGAAVWPSGRNYAGEFRDDQPNGQGTMTLADGTEFVGQFKAGKPDGQITVAWADGRKFIGEYRDGRMEGVGKMVYPDGKVQGGLWKQDQFVGSLPN